MSPLKARCTTQKRRRRLCRLTSSVFCYFLHLRQNYDDWRPAALQSKWTSVVHAALSCSILTFLATSSYLFSTSYPFSLPSLSFAAYSCCSRALQLASLSPPSFSRALLPLWRHVSPLSFSLSSQLLPVRQDREQLHLL